LEAWVRRKKEQNRIKAAEIKFLKAVKECTKGDRKSIESIRDELQIYSIENELDESGIKLR
jgi:hypothetical protein